MTYKIKPVQLSEILAKWTNAMASDPQLLWWYDAASMDEEALAIYNDQFARLADWFAHMKASGRLTLRIFLDEYDDVCGVTGTATLYDPDGREIPFSVRFTKKTKESKKAKTESKTVTQNLTIKAMPVKGGTGLNLSAEFVQSGNSDGVNKREIDARLNVRINGTMYRLDTEASFLCEPASETAELIEGSGTLRLRRSGEDVIKVDFSERMTGVFGENIRLNGELTANIETTGSARLNFELSPGDGSFLSELYGSTNIIMID
ncbi:hypothetical protein FACS18948_5550 [Clostridia bacterium]|nr:hypothetical protein FACS18948_5550 [Clostridia bacterium]